jgi:hypothetical protein
MGRSLAAQWLRTLRPAVDAAAELQFVIQAAPPLSVDSLTLLR